jgi:hypothetical protein
MRVLIAAMLLASLAACSQPAATSTPSTANPGGTSHVESAPPPQGVSFQMPSGNIGCNYTPAGGTQTYHTADNRAELQCDRIEPTYVRITLPELGAAHITPTDERGCCGGETIAYGDTWNDGPFTCEIHQTSLVCRNRDDHGFTLSRTEQDVH